MSRKKISLIVAPWKFDVIKTSGFALASRANICFKNIKFPRGNADINARHVLVTVVNKIGRPNTTRTVRLFTLDYEGHFVLCHEEKSYSR